ncbi:MAG: Phospholipase/Carboxylesterase [Fibrobacteres bacterium]|nr:Phospholipase/Carboxylesterase [Fibrobacterota bacterium]
MPQFLVRIVIPAFILSCLVVSGIQGAEVSAFEARWWKVNPSKSIPFRLFLPKNRVPGKKYPVMLALHGAGERGTDNSSQLNNGFSNFWADDSIQKADPCFVVVPQCPLNEQWVICPPPWDNYDFTKSPITDNLKAVMAILDSLEREFPIDEDREYVSGMSMGGQGTWYSIMAFPDRFAAAVPVCGSSDPNQAPRLDAVNIWTFHAADDNTVAVRNTQAMVAAIRAVGGSRLKYTEYPASMRYGHESWKPAGRDPALHRWVFSQVRGQATALRPGRSRVSIATGRYGAANGVPDVLSVDGLGRLHLRRIVPVPVFPR